MLTRDELVSVMPGAAGIADRVIPALDAALQRFDIATPAREAAFLAQLAHESGQLKHWKESLNYGWQGLLKTFPKYFKTEAEARAFERKEEPIANRVYGDRMGNGPESSGDGWRYRGRGPIQLTGKDNYRACGTAIGFDLVNEPERLETPEVGCLAAGWYWSSNGLNALADAGDFVAITRKINKALLGLEERTAFWQRAKAVFGVTAPAVAAPRAWRGMAGAETLERAEVSSVAARRKPVKPRVRAAPKAGAKAAKPRVASAKKAGKKKAAKPRIASAKKPGTKSAKRRVASAKKPGTKAAKPRITAAKKAIAKAAKSRATPARKTGTKAGKPRATAANRRVANATGTSRAKAPKKMAKKSAKRRPSAVRRTRAK